jgi:hypothetical protein
MFAGSRLGHPPSPAWRQHGSGGQQEKNQQKSGGIIFIACKGNLPCIRKAAEKKVKYWRIIADRLSKSGWSSGCVGRRGQELERNGYSVETSGGNGSQIGGAKCGPAQG